jgi:sec-independent protein translocase protein TatB
MLGISWYEYLVIAVVALIVIGPKELPAVLRAVGQWVAKIQRMAAEFRGQFQEAMREAEMADLKKEVDNIGEQAKGFTSQFNDPVTFPDAMKWEPKTETSTSDLTTSEPTPAPELGKPDDVVKPIEDSPALASSDAHGGGQGTADAAAGQPAAIGQPVNAQAAGAPGAAGTAPAAAPPASSEGSAPKAEEGVHS